MLCWFVPDTVSSQTIQVNSQEKATYTAATTLLQDLDHSRTGIGNRIPKFQYFVLSFCIQIFCFCLISSENIDKNLKLFFF